MSVTKRRTFGSLPSIFDDIFDSDFFDKNNFSSAGTTMPSVNIRESEKEFIIEVAAPGMKREDFHIDLTDHVLSISSEKEDTEESSREGNYIQREFNFLSFKRSFTLPTSVQEKKIKAEYNTGVLVLTLPKSPHNDSNISRKIPIK